MDERNLLCWQNNKKYQSEITDSVKISKYYLVLFNTRPIDVAVKTSGQTNMQECKVITVQNYVS